MIKQTSSKKVSSSKKISSVMNQFKNLSDNVTRQMESQLGVRHGGMDYDVEHNVYVDHTTAITPEDDCSGRKISRLYDNSDKGSKMNMRDAKAFYNEMTEDEEHNKALRRERAIRNAIVISEIIGEPVSKKRHHRRGR